MQMRHTVFLGMAAVLFTAACSSPKEEPETYRMLGGTYSVRDSSENAFSHPYRIMNNDEKDRFALGKSFFHVPWVEAPSATTARDGLGPLFSANTCSNCHLRNGAGVAVDAKGNIQRSLVLRLSRPGLPNPRNGFSADETYGAQLSMNGVFDVPYEGKPMVSYQERSGTYPDGTRYSLREPCYSVTQLQYGPLGEDTVIAPRIALALVGLGLVEKISEKEILQHADEHDADGDGISGRPNWVYSLESSVTKLGRFTWKASSPTVKQQVASAMSNDMGLTTPLFPKENCTQNQKECLQAPKGAHAFDVTEERLDAVTFYVSTHMVPEQRHPEKVEKGAKRFASLGCVKCHTDTFSMQDGSLIHPFSDFLLHDMGSALADGRAEFEATGSEWRTAPLWGIGLYKRVSKEANYLHDGRARSIEEALLWHGGEAEASKQAFMHLNKRQRGQLLEFLESL